MVESQSFIFYFIFSFPNTTTAITDPNELRCTETSGLEDVANATGYSNCVSKSRPHAELTMSRHYRIIVIETLLASSAHQDVPLVALIDILLRLYNAHVASSHFSAYELQPYDH